MSIRKTTNALTILFLLLLSAQSSFAQATARAGEGQLIEAKITSASLKNNLLGDPAEQTVAIYLPPSYQTSPTKRYPTVYLLHGFTGKTREWTTDGYQGMNLPPLMDEMIKKWQKSRTNHRGPQRSQCFRWRFLYKLHDHGKLGGLHLSRPG